MFRFRLHGCRGFWEVLRCDTMTREGQSARGREGGINKKKEAERKKQNHMEKNKQTNKQTPKKVNARSMFISSPARKQQAVASSSSIKQGVKF